MKLVQNKPPKLCFAKAGDVIRITDNNTGLVCPQTYLVAVIPDDKKKKARMLSSNGLYSDERDFWIVDTTTGEVRELPHLSERIVIYRNAALHLNDDKEDEQWIPQ
jgi:hypothetical protein